MDFRSDYYQTSSFKDLDVNLYERYLNKKGFNRISLVANLFLIGVIKWVDF